MKHRAALSFGLYFTATCLLLWAGFMSWQYWQSTSTGDVTPLPETVIISTETPSERTPPPIEKAQAYTVAAEKPRAIEIASIGVSGFIQQVGVDQFGQIAVPTNVHFAGWYVKSALPGQAGVTIIDGHVGGRFGGAIFSKLATLSPGDEVRLQKGDLSWLTYRVEKNMSISPEDTKSLYEHQTDSPSELHLITCDGVYNSDSKTYDKRSLVIAEPVNPLKT